MNNREKFWSSPDKNLNRKQIEEGIYDHKNEETELEQLQAQKDRHEALESAEALVGIIDTKSLVYEYPYLKEQIYSWYYHAMIRRGREPLAERNFLYHFFESGSIDQTFSFGNKEKGFLLGFFKNEVFVPTHFAPKTIRGGYELIKELGESKTIASVMSITPDLVETISKMPTWHVLDLGFLSDFRGESIEKKVVYNSYPGIEERMQGLVQEYFDESNSGYDEDGEEYNELDYVEDL